MSFKQLSQTAKLLAEKFNRKFGNFMPYFACKSIKWAYRDTLEKEAKAFARQLIEGADAKTQAEFYAWIEQDYGLTM